MRAIWLACLLLFVAGTSPHYARAQADELAQLALNIEKLAELKKILQSMYDGYRIISEGYNKVKDITSGNYKLHELFLDGLYLVSPAVRKYARVADILSYQLTMVREYKAALKQFRSSGAFDADYLAYLATVYKRLMDDTLFQLDELTMILTAQQLRMSDDERLAAIDRIYNNMEQKLLFLRSFNTQQKLVAIAGMKEKTELSTLRSLHGIDKQ
ncbi:TerB family tellurite resistance protein [Chitinophaga filiformis]|uniref:TerB family tellurite resistance protein n=1 Tax=Chitinophaga filiformis TaxID=104663 RepID=A0ABY4HWS3_CHIFI|nr:TerB family tellurite resistance protein [Chitinophaga filiformis]UPK68027.1 TerB family tellurite resistance protein [Chitinophaga filiformis]